MRRLLPILLVLCACSAQAAYITIEAVFTNRSLISSNFVINGTTVTYTNAPLNGTTWIVTNNAANNATNLQRFLGANYRSLSARMTNATNVIISGNDLQFSFPGNGAAHFAFTVTNSSTETNWHALMLPFDRTPYATNRTNDADELIYGINKYAHTNTFSMSAQALTNFVSRTNFQLVTHKLLNLSSLSNSFVLDSVFNQGSFSNRIINAGTIVGGNYTNDTHTNGVWGSGSLMGRITSTAIITGGGISNSAIDRAFLTNATFVSGTLTGTVLNITGSGAGIWMTIESTSTTAALGPTIAFNRSDGAGSFAETEDLAMQLVALGYGDTDYQPLARIKAYAQTNIADANSPGRLEFAVTPVGASATATRMTIDGDKVVVTNAPFTAAMGITNQVFRGTNVINARLDFVSRANTGLADGYNAGTILGSNVVVRLSGHSAAATNAGFAAPGGEQFVILEVDNPTSNYTLLDQSGLDSAANRIVTGTAALLNSTNNPVMIQLLYSTTASRWRVLSFR